MPKIKTFRFRRGTSQNEIDATINAWLESRADSGGSFPQFGKVGVGLFSVYFVFFLVDPVKPE